MAGCLLPKLLNDSSCPSDVKDRVTRILDSCDGRSTGSYTNSAGVPIIREWIAKFIEARDGIETKSSNVYLTTGASGGIKMIMELLLTESDKKPGFMIPIPQ
jgi:alanine transaminase